MIKVIPFKPGHMDFMTLKSCHDGENVAATMEALWGQQGAHVKTLVADGIPIAVIALLHIREGVAECIMGASDLVKKHKVSFVKTIKGMNDEYAKKLNLRRIHITIRDGHPELTRWAGFLGFELEGRMRKFGSNGTDSFMYARVY